MKKMVSKLLFGLALTTNMVSAAKIDTTKFLNRYEFGGLMDTVLQIPIRIQSSDKENIKLSTSIGSFSKGSFTNDNGKWRIFFDTITIDKRITGTGVNILEIRGTNIENVVSREVLVPPMYKFFGDSLFKGKSIESTIKVGDNIWISTRSDAVQGDTGTVYKINYKTGEVTDYFEQMNTVFSAYEKYAPAWEVHNLFSDGKENLFLRINLNDSIKLARFSNNSIEVISTNLINYETKAQTAYDNDGNIYFFKNVEEVVGYSVKKYKKLFKIPFSKKIAELVADSTIFKGYLDFFKIGVAYNVNSISFDRDGYLWVTTDSCGLYKFDLANKTVTRDSSVFNKNIFTNAPKETFWDIEFGLNDTKWLATEERLAFFDGTSWNDYSSVKGPFYKNTPLGYSFDRFIYDTDSTILIKTGPASYRSVFRFNPRDSSLNLLISQKMRYNNDYFEAIKVGKDSLIVINKSQIMLAVSNDIKPIITNITTEKSYNMVNYGICFSESENIVTFSLPRKVGDISYRLYNPMGRIILNKKIINKVPINSYQLDLDNIAAKGWYIFSVSTKDITQNYKVIVK